jgi:hypothetical protein
MSEQPLTASAIISFSTDLEERSAGFYRELGQRFAAHAATFAGFAEECAKSIVQVSRTYQETVTDALETGYSFSGLSLQDYEADTALPEGIDLGRAVSQALALEKKAEAFYQDAATKSASLLATIPRAFSRAAKVHRRRQEALASL